MSNIRFNQDFRVHADITSEALKAALVGLPITNVRVIAPTVARGIIQAPNVDAANDKVAACRAALRTAGMLTRGRPATAVKTVDENGVKSWVATGFAKVG